VPEALEAFPRRSFSELISDRFRPFASRNPPIAPKSAARAAIAIDLPFTPRAVYQIAGINKKAAR
jgi:hypothetical protein